MTSTGCLAFFGKDGITIGNQAFDLGLTKKYKWAGDGAIAESVNLPALGNKIEGFVGINRICLRSRVVWIRLKSHHFFG